MVKLKLVLICILSATSAQAASIDAGHHLLQPNTPGQKIAIYVTGGEEIASVDLYMQIGDGGPELVQLGLPAGEDAPGVQSPFGLPNLNLENPTFGSDFGIFGSIPHTGQYDALSGLGGSIPQLVGVAILTSSFLEPGNANGLLATFVIDTTGFTSGTWPLLLEGTLAGDTTMYDNQINLLALTIINGSLTIVPEPHSVGLCFTAAFAFAGWHRRRSSCRKSPLAQLK